GVFHLLEWSPDGRRLAAGHLHSAVSLLDPHTGTQVRSLAAAATRLAWAPDSKTLATGDDSAVTFWDAATGKRGESLTAASTTYLQWWPGRPVAYEGLGSGVWLWDTATCRLLHRLEHSAALYSWAPSRDGKTLACSAADQALVLWDTAKG